MHASVIFTLFFMFFVFSCRLGTWTDHLWLDPVKDILQQHDVQRYVTLFRSPTSYKNE